MVLKRFPRILRSDALRYLAEDKAAVIGAAVFILFAFTALTADFISPHDPYKSDLLKSLRPPFWIDGGDTEHLLGCDGIGRDILSRIIFGARVSFTAGVISVGGAILFGVVLGSVAGYYGGKIDTLLMRIVDIWLSFPTILLAIALMAAIGPGFWNVVLVMVATSWVPFCRVIRGEFLSLRTRPFVMAAQATGAGDSYIISREILPNTFPSLIVLATFQLARNIIYEASLSFLGIGVSPPTPSWGSMLGFGRQHILYAWWVSTFPGLAITLVVLSINLLGDGLRDALDPRLRRAKRV